MEGIPDPGSFGAAFEKFIRAMTAAAERPQPEIVGRLRDHLGAEPKSLPTTSGEFATTDRATLQLALDELLEDTEVLGFAGRFVGMEPPGIADLVEEQQYYGPPLRLGQVHYTDVEVGDGRVVKCVSTGLFLARYDGVPLALVLAQPSEHHPMQAAKLRLEGVAADSELISRFLRDLRETMRAKNVYRGKTIMLHADSFGGVTVKFQHPPEVPRDAVVLPQGTLDRLDLHAIGVTEHADALEAAGRHLKRGILLHGPPGTGKTLTVSYLLGAMPGRTTVLLTGAGLTLVGTAMSIARELAPATLVFEDIDLVAGERTMHFAHGGLLFELLNEMEGIAEDEDLLFLLTTNRPDLIEPALAARPGRIDLALEIPLPDQELRRRLIELYADGVELADDERAALAERSAGVSGAFIRELVRQAWLRSSVAGRGAPTGADLSTVLDELLDERNALTRRLLGQQGDEGSTDSGVMPGMLHAMRAAGMPVQPFVIEDDEF